MTIIFFSSDLGSVSVEIDGAVCVVSNVIDTEIECDTGSHLGSANSKVEVQVSGNGIAQEVCETYLKFLTLTLPDKLNIYFMKYDQISPFFKMPSET